MKKLILLKEKNMIMFLTFVIEDIDGKKKYKKITRVLNLNDGTENEIVEEIPEEEIKKYFDEDEIEDEMKLYLILLKEIKKMIEKLKNFLRLKKKKVKKKKK